MIFSPLNLYIWKNIGTLTQFTVCCVVIQTMFQYVTSLMKQGYHEESNRQRHLALSPKERPDKRNTALWDASSVNHNSDCFYRFNTEMCLCIYCIYYRLLLYIAHVYHSQCLLLYHKGPKKTCSDFEQSTLFLNLNSAAGLGSRPRQYKWLTKHNACCKPAL